MIRDGSADLRRFALMLMAGLGCALAAIDFGAPIAALVLSSGDVAPATVTAPFAFQVADREAYERQREEAAAAVSPVFVHDVGQAQQTTGRIRAAFEAGRGALDAGASGEAGRIALRAALRGGFGVELPDDVLDELVHAGLPPAAEALVVDLVAQSGRRLVVVDRNRLPPDGRSIRIVSHDGAAESTWTASDRAAILTPDDARQQVTLSVLEGRAAGSELPQPVIEACTAVARALVAPNLRPDEVATGHARDAARVAVPLEMVTYKKGAIVTRAGDVLTPRQVRALEALRDSRDAATTTQSVAAAALLLCLFFFGLYQFASENLPGFSRSVRDATTASVLLVAVAWLSSLLAALGPGVTNLVALDLDPGIVAFALPVGGASMLVRLLLGAPWAPPFALAAAVVAALPLSLEPIHLLFFLVAAGSASGSVDATQERMTVIRAGVQLALVQAIMVLVLAVSEQFVLDGVLRLGPNTSTLWAMGAAALGGVASAGVVLVALPVFEAAGYVTDYRLMELANINHPLLRQLLQRAPGSYHHSVNVGTLAETACEAIGANGLRARVAAYFHDVGKSLQPAWFVENQLDGVNRHDNVQPEVSAQIIIRHVVDGAKLAREHSLPQPVIDNILMHHGTGLLPYFYEAARQAAKDGEPVDEAAFRYPGPKPNSREAGVIMLADKVEAASRTLSHPDERNIRGLITRVINSVMADGQFSDCPLTVREIHIVYEAFVRVLIGFHHHRIAYPETADLARAGARTVNPQTITLELPSPPALPAPDDLGDRDYESVEHLPRGGG